MTPPAARGDAFDAGLVVSMSGLGLAALHLLHGTVDVGLTPRALAFGVAFPFLVSAFIVGAGYWLARHDWGEVSPWRVVGWFAGGLVLGSGLTALLIGYQRAEGVSPADPFFVVMTVATYGGAVGLLVGRYDVRRRVQLVRQSNEAAQLDEFARVVSHDLRNPLNVAMGRLELARQERDSEDLEAVARSHERMASLIEEVLTSSRPGTGSASEQWLSLAEHVENGWQQVDTFDATVRVETAAEVRADPTRLSQLLENLFRNAVAYGGQDVRVTVGDLLEEPGFYVEDDGPGIPANERERVFEFGYSTTEAGTGYGLAIVERVAEAHDWDVRLTQSEDGGARFEFTGVPVRG